MTQINRRGLIGIAGAGLIVSGCSKAQDASKRTNIPKDDYENTTFDPIWNYGQQPWDTVPQGWDKAFNPDYLCVVHIELASDLRIITKRVHRPAVKSPANDWSSNKANAVDIINKLNRGDALPPTDKLFEGLKNFAFGQAHHVVFYVKNSAAEFDSEYPIWFGKKLRNAYKGSKKAEPNESFFGANPETINSISGGSKSVTYVENHFKVGSGNAHKPIPKDKNLIYSLNLNVVVPSNEDATYTIPLIIDPDTGNMGSGGPP
jgi:hypothetical protein